MKTSVAIGTIWVCLCCLFAREGDGDGCDGNGGCAGDPWAEIPDGYTVTLGMFREEHADGCKEGDECDCERRTFSWRPCEGCGSSLGGERQAYTLWQEP